ncbi:MAG: hypothetical protein H8E35_16210 [Ardenticatenia bacterium]|nr:hypothetical protein [Ardenticatenia bacterium]
MKDWILLTIVVSMLTGWLIGCTRTPSSETLIEYRRSGGFAGLDDGLVIKGNGEATLTRKSERYEFTLDSDTISRLQTIFEEAEFSQLRKEYPPSRQGSDLFEYVVTYKGHTVRTMDGSVPPSLQHILEALNQIVESQGNP